MGDTQTWAELALISEIAVIQESLATWRVLDESASKSKDRKKGWRFCKSSAEVKLYLCEKHSLSEEVQRNKELEWFDSSLKLAFYERNTDLAMEVKKRKQTFTWKEWLRYYGAKNGVCYYVCRVVFLTLNPFRKKIIN